MADHTLSLGYTSASSYDVRKHQTATLWLQNLTLDSNDPGAS